MRALRRIPLHHGHNVRDVGGYPIGEQHMSAWNVLFRSDDLHAFDEHDWEVLRAYHIGCILDLRSNEEIQASNYNSEDYGIRHVCLPFMKDVKGVAPIDESAEALHQFMMSMKLDYVKICKEGSNILCIALQEIAQTLMMKKAVLFHCTAGKDRTGILACILLLLCGVTKEDILADYQVSSTYNRQGIAMRLPKELMELTEIRELFESRVDMLEPLIDFLEVEGCEAYLRKIGVTKETIEQIRSICVVSSTV